MKAGHTGLYQEKNSCQGKNQKKFKKNNYLNLVYCP
jgi:hypothetical protein